MRRWYEGKDSLGSAQHIQYKEDNDYYNYKFIDCWSRSFLVLCFYLT